MSIVLYLLRVITLIRHVFYDAVSYEGGLVENFFTRSYLDLERVGVQIGVDDVYGVSGILLSLAPSLDNS